MRVLILTFTLAYSQSSFAVLDFLTSTAKDAAKATAYTSSISDLARELDTQGDSGLTQSALSLEARERYLNSKLSSARTTAYDFSSLSDSNHSLTHSRRLLDSLHYSARFAERSRSLLTKTGILGPDVATAANTAETTAALNEVVRNQQAEMLMRREERLAGEEEKMKWSEFIEAERSVRRGLGPRVR